METLKRLEFLQEVPAEVIEQTIANLGIPLEQLRVVQSCEQRRVMQIFKLVPVKQEAA